MTSTLELKIKSVHLRPQTTHLNCKFGEIPLTSLWNITSTRTYAQTNGRTNRYPKNTMLPAQFGDGNQAISTEFTSMQNGQTGLLYVVRF